MALHEGLLLHHQLPQADVALSPEDPGHGDPLLRRRAEHRQGLQESQEARSRLRLLRQGHPLHHLVSVRVAGGSLAPGTELQRLDVSGAEQVLPPARAGAHPRRKHHSLRPEVHRLAGQARKAAAVLRQQHRSQRLQGVLRVGLDAEPALRQPVRLSRGRRERGKLNPEALSQDQGGHSEEASRSSRRGLHRVRALRQERPGLHDPGLREARERNGGCLAHPSLEQLVEKTLSR